MKPVCKNKINTSFAIGDSLLKKIDRLAEKNGISRSEAIRVFVLKAFEKDETR